MKFRKKDKIAVIDRNGNVLKVITRKPHTKNGFDSYIYNGELVPGYWNGAICNDVNTSAFIYNNINKS